MTYFIIFAAAFAVSLLLTPLATRLSHRLGIVAVPGGRRQHSGLVAVLGGVPLFVALMVSWLLIGWLLPASPSDGLLRGVMWGTAVMFLGGLIDDKFELPFWVLFLFQFAALGVAMGHELFIERFTLPGVGLIAISEQVGGLWGTVLIFTLTFFWVVGMINTINFLDGLDGLASSVGMIAALFFAWHSYGLDQFSVAAFPLALAGALLGFLPFNSAPARIFLGSAGAYLLAYQLGTLSIVAPAKIATALLVLAVPILDVAWRIVDRLRQGRSPFEGDRGHLHYLLLDNGVEVRTIVFGYCVVAMTFGFVAILPGAGPLLKLLLLLGLATAVFLLLLYLSRRVPSTQELPDRP